MSENIRSRKRPGQARIEFRACRKEVEEKVAAGYSNIMIYEELTATGKLTVSYSAFCDYIRGNGARLHNRRKPIIPRSGEVNPVRRPANSEPFSIDRSLTMKDLIGPFAKD
jgi:hypothetical protein